MDSDSSDKVEQVMQYILEKLIEGEQQFRYMAKYLLIRKTIKAICRDIEIAIDAPREKVLISPTLL